MSRHVIEVNYSKGNDAVVLTPSTARRTGANNNLTVDCAQVAPPVGEQKDSSLCFLHTDNWFLVR